ncbi:A/G-specific adenine glycosylase [Candidatus Nitrosacidococcus sp. I8]|uniref:A/G-specific adenine glycosylase n=1 Tax=Candidatus Nitrosacidococcus sp. I8 TaxID=2942908 RepID=UPI0022262C8C|nr:A/G-specific adenine glycosylase [Candidatus Nitrosacidococcus sp. I8]CAH9017745.1 Adenine DNA glycosylase [Candidatus Nitrosacidococcus sp. I8]
MKQENLVSFSQSLLEWFDSYGRKHLPWKINPTPYRVWVSEIMLQQTQVTTVISYYERFTKHFSDLSCLAQASVDEVLELWAGLGYYARGRNLHRAAQIAWDTYGEIPPHFEDLIKLPGIGRSTAGAILALALNQSYPVLDGNVKRILTRQYAINDWFGHPRIEKLLWQYAEELLPTERVADYTQALMDLGATVCTRQRPKCSICPIKDSCQAYFLGTQGNYPVPKPQKNPLSLRTTQMVILSNHQQEIFLEHRPLTGIWGGLWSFPECSIETNLESWCEDQFNFNYQVESIKKLPSLRHRFTHFILDIYPVLVQVSSEHNNIAESNQKTWVSTKKAYQLGLPAPTLKLLKKLNEASDLKHMV